MTTSTLDNDVREQPEATNREAGYTLVELLIVIAIIGILANIIVPVVLTQLQKAKATRLVSEYKLLQNAEANYLTDTGSTPPRRVLRRLPPELDPYVVGDPIAWVEGTGLHTAAEVLHP